MKKSTKHLPTVGAWLTALAVGTGLAGATPVMDGVINSGEYCNFLHVDNGAPALPGMPYDMYWDNDATTLFVAFDGSATPDPGLSPYVHHVFMINVCQVLSNPDTPVVALNISTDCIVPQYFEFNSSTQMIEYVDSDDFYCQGDPQFDNAGMVLGFQTDYILERSYPFALLQNPPVTNPPAGAILSIDTSDVSSLAFSGGANDPRGVDGPNASPLMTFGCPGPPFDVGQCPAAATDHFQCYDAKTAPGTPNFMPRDVTLADQFWSRWVTVQKPKALCNPVDKDGEGIHDPTAHLTCYELKEIGGQPPFQRRDVLVEDQFGRLILSVEKAQTLCVPSEKDHVASELNLDHFQCYKAKMVEQPGDDDDDDDDDLPGVFEPRVVTLTDQFGSAQVTVVEPEALCNPVDKNSEGILDPETHLTCYKITQGIDAGRNAAIENQFGPLTLNVKKAETLCVPSSKTDLP
jgi:hypothetical protein